MRTARLFFLAGVGAVALSTAFVCGIFAAAEALETALEVVVDDDED